MSFKSYLKDTILGEMAEWSIASDLKSEELGMVPWVRIPLSLLNIFIKNIGRFF